MEIPSRDLEANGFVMTRVYVHEKMHYFVCIKHTKYIRHTDQLQDAY